MLVRNLQFCYLLFRTTRYTLPKFHLSLPFRRNCHFNQSSDSLRYNTSVEECMPYYNELVEDLTDSMEINEFVERYQKLLNYNIPTGKRLRVRATVTAYKILESPEKVTPENLRLAYILGWCIEFLNGSYLIMDDIEDSSIQRRGLPCWYRVEGIGMSALTDSSLIEHSVFKILKKFLSSHACYVPVMETFHNASLMSGFGQMLDIQRPPYKNGACDLSFFSENRYNAISKYKTYYYTVELPVKLAMHLTGKYDMNSVKLDMDILRQMAYFFQAQNDFLDCFNFSSITGKSGTDIQEAKCTWLIVTALKRASPTQKKLLEENFGKKSSESVSIVYNIYKELNIPEVYYSLENSALNLFRKYQNKTFPNILFEKIGELFCKKLSSYGL